jgi:short-subunit dehydrogenase
MCQLVLPGMRRPGYGRIINASSMGGKLTFPGAGYYHATKHAVEAISDALRFEVEGFGVKISVIEPGLTRTGFANAAVGSMDGPESGPCAGFDEAVAKATMENYERGPISRLAGEPGAVAEAIERALSVQNPRRRYAVTPSAHLFLGLRRLLPDGAWDAVLRTSYPQPGR